MDNKPKTGRDDELKPCLHCADRRVGCHGKNADGSYRCGRFAAAEAARAEEQARLAVRRREGEIDRYQRHKFAECNAKAEKARLRGRGR